MTGKNTEQKKKKKKKTAKIAKRLLATVIYPKQTFIQCYTAPLHMLVGWPHRNMYLQQVISVKKKYETLHGASLKQQPYHRSTEAYNTYVYLTVVSKANIMQKIQCCIHQMDYSAAISCYILAALSPAHATVIFSTWFIADDKHCYGIAQHRYKVSQKLIMSICSCS